MWDGTTKLSAIEIAMNEITSMNLEADITFGLVYLAFITWIWNLRISFPLDDIMATHLPVPRCRPGIYHWTAFLCGQRYGIW